jgi:hypothetical protein
VIPVSVLAGVAVAVFAGFYALDQSVTGGTVVDHPSTALSRYVHFDPDHITDAVSALAGMVAAVLGIVITVVSIIVQLSADRYTGVAQLFLRDRINIGVMAYFVVACVCGVFVSLSVQKDFAPRATLVVMIGATVLGLVIMLPYFAYVFWFLDPKNIIVRIRSNAVAAVRGALRSGSAEACVYAQEPAIGAMEELSDITSNSISGKDKIIASRAVDALKDYVLQYLEVKQVAPAEWFTIGDGIRQNPDFVAMAPESLRDLETRRTWVEWMALRQYLGIYNEALAAMPDINYLIAIDTRYIGEAAGARNDSELVRLVYRYVNSYLRAALNARNVRTAYNVLNQYRLLIEALLRQGKGAAAVEGIRYMKYYGHVSFDMNVPFVTETVAHDMSSLCEYAHDLGTPEQDQMLDAFLELDQPLREKNQERGLLGVRKAQVKLAAYYLFAGEEEKARRIAADMQGEPPSRMAKIKDELERVESKDFWEIIDRGRNFEYMPPERREKVGVFLEWLKPDAAQRASGATG